MSIIDDIKRDREAGTPGPFMIDGRLVYTLQETGDSRHPYENRFMLRGDMKFGVDPTESELAANMRRAARIPQMEAALLAAERLAKAVDFYQSPPLAEMRDQEDWDAMIGALADYYRIAPSAYHKATNREGE